MGEVNSSYSQPIKLIVTEVEIDLDGDKKKDKGTSFYCQRCAINFVKSNLFNEVMTVEAIAPLILVDNMLPCYLTKEEWDTYNDWERCWKK